VAGEIAIVFLVLFAVFRRMVQVLVIPLPGTVVPTMAWVVSRTVWAVGLLHSFNPVLVVRIDTERVRGLADPVTNRSPPRL